jgi:NAD(P)-dependent dehydrogenase (short-subunit alcohol dehydrogenase family)
MRDLVGKVAVVTGAASGIGRALVERFVHEEMRVVLADLDTGTLAAAEAGFRARGAVVRAIHCDVARADEVQSLAEETLSAFGAVHIVCNNAGVFSAGPACWEVDLSEWDRMLGINLMGVIHGIHTFVPIMLEQGTEGHIVNTASAAGLGTGPYLGPYHVGKHGVVAVSEVLYHELAARGSSIKVSVVCPGFVQTAILDAELRRSGGQPTHPEVLSWFADTMHRSGMAANTVAEQVAAAIRAEQFYVLTHPDREFIRTRMENILAGRNPALEGD